MKTRLLLFGLLLALCAGCQTYSERFTYLDPKTGATNHVVTIKLSQCLVGARANQISTKTQTMEFIREVNAQGLEVKPDAESVQAIVQGVSEAVIQAVTRP